MSWLLIVVLAIILVSAIRGAVKGFLRLLFSLAAVVILIWLVAFATPHISGFIQTHTAIGTKVAEYFSEKIELSMEGAMDSAVANQEQSLEATGIQLPNVLHQLVFETGVEKVEETVSQSGIYQQMGDQIAGVVLAVISFVIALILALVIVAIIGKITDLANKIPVLGGVNRFVGFFAGGFLGFVIVWLVFMVVGVMSGTQLAQLILTQIQDNVFLSALYNDNLLLKIIIQFLHN